MKKNQWLPYAICLTHCIDKELYKAVDYLLEYVFFWGGASRKAGQSYSAYKRQRMRAAQDSPVAVHRSRVADGTRPASLSGAPRS